MSNFSTIIDNGTAERIDAACFRDGMECEFIVEFFHISGSIFRSCYNQRTTCAEYEWIPLGWEFDELMKRYRALHYSI